MRANVQNNNSARSSSHPLSTAWPHRTAATSAPVSSASDAFCDQRQADAERRAPAPQRRTSTQIRMLGCFALQRCRIDDVTDHAIVVADVNGTITWWSPSAEALFGHSAAAALGQRLDLI